MQFKCLLRESSNRWDVKEIHVEASPVGRVCNGEIQAENTMHHVRQKGEIRGLWLGDVWSSNTLSVTRKIKDRTVVITRLFVL